MRLPGHELHCERNQEWRQRGDERVSDRKEREDPHRLAGGRDHDEPIAIRWRDQAERSPRPAIASPSTTFPRRPSRRRSSPPFLESPTLGVRGAQRSSPGVHVGIDLVIARPVASHRGRNRAAISATSSCTSGPWSAAAPLVGPARASRGRVGPDEHENARGELGIARRPPTSRRRPDLRRGARGRGRGGAGRARDRRGVAEIVRVERGRAALRHRADNDSVIPQEAGLNERAVVVRQGVVHGRAGDGRTPLPPGQPHRHLRGLRLSSRWRPRRAAAAGRARGRPASGPPWSPPPTARSRWRRPPRGRARRDTSP